ncbi:MAG: aminotransferase class I/II-fold pyridoxal phosphate-dependent enzyme [Deltaproteobacteria bacterium]|nr:aminotransferase class I/II-fold pyridoxal phosphate-dependent enzyme [Deltaproteobacteria bacterium]
MPVAFLEAVAKLRAAYPEAPSKYPLPLTTNTFGDAEIAAALEALVCGPMTLGPRVAAFEAAFARAHGAADAVFCNSGSSANLLAIAVLARPQGPDQGPDLRPGDEVIVPSVTWSTTIWPVAQVGCVPVLADVDPQTLNVTVESIERALSPRTKAVFLAHILGNPAPVEAIAELCRQRGLVLVEDVCESLDAETSGRRCGTFGRMGTFSFYFSHHICTVEGGMVVCQDPADGDRLRIQRAHGWTRNLPTESKAMWEQRNPDVDPRFLFVDSGYNLRATDVQAAIGLVQLERRHAFLQRRRAVGEAWGRVRDRFADVYVPMQIAPGSSHFALPIVLQPGLGLGRAELADFLERHGVENRPLVAGNLARQPALAHVPHRIAGPLTGADALHERAMYVGIHPSQTDADVELLSTLLGQFAHQARQSRQANEGET